MLASIRSGGESREAAARYLLETYVSFVPRIRRQFGLDREAALDAFTDAVLALVGQVATGVFEERSKVSTYLYQIFYYKARDVFKKNTTNRVSYLAAVPDQTHDDPPPDEAADQAEALQTLVRELDRLGEPCRRILLDWGYWGYSMEEIARRNGLPGPEQAKKQKYKCLQRIRKNLPRV
ncbi:MAG: hypothetical protein OHK0039_05880 [Bacteroidia bacterium]